MRMCELVPIWFQKYVATLLGHVTTLDAMSCCPPISLRLNRMSVETPTLITRPFITLHRYR